MAKSKSMYRCTVEFVDEELRATRPSVLFIRAVSANDALTGAKQTFSAACIKNNLRGSQFKLDVLVSSEKEMEEYKRGMQHRVN